MVVRTTKRSTKKNATKKEQPYRPPSAGKNNTEPLFVNFVKQWREKKGLTQAELAQKIGIAVQQIYRLENHSVALTYQMASRLQPVLCHHIGQLFSEDPNIGTDETVSAAFSSLPPKDKALTMRHITVFARLTSKGKAMATEYVELLDKQGFSKQT